MSNKKDKTGIQLTRVLVIALSGQEDLNCSVEGEDVCRGGPDPGTVVVDCLGGQVDVHTGVVTNLSAGIQLLIISYWTVERVLN